jgi:hypothetical protein
MKKERKYTFFGGFRAIRPSADSAQVRAVGTTRILDSTMIDSSAERKRQP